MTLLIHFGLETLTNNNNILISAPAIIVNRYCWILKKQFPSFCISYSKTAFSKFEFPRFWRTLRLKIFRTTSAAYRHMSSHVSLSMRRDAWNFRRALLFVNRYRQVFATSTQQGNEFSRRMLKVTGCYALSRRSCAQKRIFANSNFHANDLPGLICL